MPLAGSAALAVVLAYLVGSIPFAYLIVRAAKGIDIRTVGSGNVGATNAGRILGSRGFLLVFLCDLLKGLLPTVLLPLASKRISGEAWSDLPVLVALASILGHNFPIFLRFRGGKGVATSLGAVLGLDPIASVAAVAAFGVTLRASRYVSLSSIVGATTFTVAHALVVLFVERKSPIDRDHIALTLLTLGLLAMLFWRHRLNWMRIRAGTEPKIGRKKREESGRARVSLVAALALIGVGGVLAARMTATARLECGPLTLVESDRARTGHQRAECPAFSEDGGTLAVLCPRYDRLLIYRVNEDDTLSSPLDVGLEGCPMALGSSGDRLWVLERPTGDDRHIRPGWLQAYGLDGAKRGGRIEVGFYPASMTPAGEGGTALVLTSGRAEGGDHRPPPALEVVDLNLGRTVATLPFDRTGDAPRRVVASATGGAAAVVLEGTNRVAMVDLTDRDHPRLLGRSLLPRADAPYLSSSGEDWMMMPVDSEASWAIVPDPLAASGGTAVPVRIASVAPGRSGISIRDAGSGFEAGFLELRGSANLGMIRPTGVASSAARGLLATTTRSGGIHLIRVGSTSPAPRPALARR